MREQGIQIFFVTLPHVRVPQKRTADSPVRDLQIFELELICNLRVADPRRLGAT